MGDIFAGKPETKQERRGPSNIVYPEKSPVKSGAFPSKRNYFTAWVEIRPGFDNHEFYQIVKVMFLLSLRWICGDSLISLSRITNKLETLRYMANRFSHKKKIRGKNHQDKDHRQFKCYNSRTFVRLNFKNTRYQMTKNGKLS